MMFEGALSPNWTLVRTPATMPFGFGASARASAESATPVAIWTKALTAKLASICAPTRFARKWVPASGMPTAVMPRAVPIEATALEMAKATGGMDSDLERGRRVGERGDPQAVLA